MKREARGAGTVIAIVVALATCTNARERSVRPLPSTLSPPPSLGAEGGPASTHGAIVEVVYDGALGKGWLDYGWAPRELNRGPASLDLGHYGGWIIAHPGLSGTFGALVFRLRAPQGHGDFLEVRVDSEAQNVYPRVVVSAEHRTAGPDGWTDITIPFRLLDPDGTPFDRIVLRASREVGGGRVEIDRIAFTAPGPDDGRPKLAPPVDVALSIDCGAPGIPISPLIYGIAYDPRLDDKDRHQWALGATARRWGGNPSSRYNWKLGNAWNTADDWYFENVDFTGRPGFTYADFLRADLDHGMQTALTVPILGWVAKDTSSYSFPLSDVGNQRGTDPNRSDAGDGRRANGQAIPAGAPSRTCVPAPPEMMRQWVEAIRASDRARGKRSVQMYILDNEPTLWDTTHRDVHPDPVGYDELLERTIQYGSAVRAADPEAAIAGPAAWGWPAYFFSGKDAAVGFHRRPDRLAHGDVPLLAWYLRKLREYEKKKGTRILDDLDVHFYPQAERVGGKNGGVDARTAELRIRSTRALWDKGYSDESWIKEPVRLIPRMKQLIEDNYPGLGLVIGEYNFGAEEHMSGGLAVAEALGRFAEGGVTAAFYWTYPPANSPAFWAFRAFRDFDGAGGRFLDRSLHTTAPAGTSLFASRDEACTHVVAVMLNLQPDQSLRPRLSVPGCGKVVSQRAFHYAGGPGGFTKIATSVNGGSSIITSDALSPYSITVFDIRFETPPPTGAPK